MRTRVLLGLGAVLLLVVGAAGGYAFRGTQGGEEPPARGSLAEGVGDPYYPDAGNRGYDVGGYDLQLRYDPATDQLDGRATITATATENREWFNLDLRVPASAVTVDDRPAAIKQEAGELRVTPERPLTSGRPFTAVVTYAGVPSTIKDGDGPPWVRSPDGALVAGEPEAAAWWFPSNDHPTDKATMSVAITVPEAVQAISNGTLLGDPEPVEPGWRRWHWRSTTPMASYLAFLTVGKYDIVRRDTPFGPFLAAYAANLDPRVAQVARASVDRSAQVVGVLSDVFGPYPFDGIGGVVPNVCDFTGALENQGRPVYGPTSFRVDVDVSIIVHELAHQWFGDSVSVRTWADIWLNEGFASYAEWLYRERTGGPSARDIANRTYDCQFGNARFWQVPPGAPGKDNIFHAAVYGRGAMALAAFRARVGDQAFFTTLRTWLAERRNGNGTVADFLATLERVSGKPVGDVAQTWLYANTRPPAPPA
ncbi:M1 family metallopeptidase [Pseudonocardia eucalypti]|uniref:Aminopeptidase N n=1 Tax=Pseudonocardia eucalypti TaxID=648755 RepID=A0ABP9R3M5_9PSEU|nr:aminopeptidase N [Pseudonocardia eucalypti]